MLLLNLLLPLLLKLLEKLLNASSLDRLPRRQRAKLAYTLQQIAAIGPAAAQAGLPLTSAEVRNATAD